MSQHQSTAETKAEQALSLVMLEAKKVAMSRHTQALKLHSVRLKEAVSLGLARRAELIREW